MLNTQEYLSSQNLLILISVVLIAVVALFLFKRKPSNQHPMEKSPDGAIATVKTDNDGR